MNEAKLAKVLKDLSFREEPTIAGTGIQVWVRGRRHGRRFTAHLLDGALTVAWTKRGEPLSATFDVDHGDPDTLEASIRGLIRS